MNRLDQHNPYAPPSPENVERPQQINIDQLEQELRDVAGLVQAIGSLMGLGGCLLVVLSFLSLEPGRGRFNLPAFALMNLVAILHWFTGRGLLHLQWWSRYTAMLLTVIWLPVLPLGTVAALPSLLILLRPRAREVFDRQDGV